MMYVACTCIWICSGDQAIAVEYLERIDAAGDAALDQRHEFTTVPNAVVDYVNTETVRLVGFQMDRTGPEQRYMRSRGPLIETWKLPVHTETEILDASV